MSGLDGPDDSKVVSCCLNTLKGRVVGPLCSVQQCRVLVNRVTFVVILVRNVSGHVAPNIRVLLFGLPCMLEPCSSIGSPMYACVVCVCSSRRSSVGTVP